METVNHNGCLGEALLGYTEHRIAEVHGYLGHLFTLRLRNFLQDSRHNISLCPFDYGYDGTFLSMSGLIGHDCINLIAEAGFIYAAASTQIVGQQHPVCRMFLLWPGFKVTEMMLVVTLDFTAINERILLMTLLSMEACPSLSLKKARIQRTP